MIIVIMNCGSGFRVQLIQETRHGTPAQKLRPADKFDHCWARTRDPVPYSHQLSDHRLEMLNMNTCHSKWVNIAHCSAQIRVMT